jgi:hypothetical protein
MSWLEFLDRSHEYGMFTEYLRRLPANLQAGSQDVVAVTTETSIRICISQWGSNGEGLGGPGGTGGRDGRTGLAGRAGGTEAGRAGGTGGSGGRDGQNKTQI